MRWGVIGCSSACVKGEAIPADRRCFRPSGIQWLDAWNAASVVCTRPLQKMAYLSHISDGAFACRSLACRVFSWLCRGVNS